MIMITMVSEAKKLQPLWDKQLSSQWLNQMSLGPAFHPPFFFPSLPFLLLFFQPHPPFFWGFLIKCLESLLILWDSFLTLS